MADRCSRSSGVTRRAFLRQTTGALLAGAGASLGLAGCATKGKGGVRKGSAPTFRTVNSPPKDIVVAEGKDFAAITRKAIEEFGGLETIIKKGDSVVLSPNMAFARDPSIGACTHPDVIRAVIQLCEQAGAGRIVVLDHVLDPDPFEANGATQAIKGTKATLISPDREAMYEPIDTPQAKVFAEFGIKDKIARDLLRAEVFIPIPVVKDHEAGKVSLSMKKLMGCNWDRQAYHRADLHRCIADLNLVLKPSLILVDATRALQTRGPKGPGETTQPNKVLVGTDPVALDTYACRFLTVKGIKPTEVPHIVQGQKLGIGTMNLDSLRIAEVTA